MKTLARLIILLGIILVGYATHDELREIASVIPPGRYARRMIIKKADDPGQYRNLMIYQWLRAGLVLGAGSVLLHFCSRADQLDPFSPDFAGKDAIDELEQTLDEEEHRRRGHSDPDEDQENK